MYKRKVKITAEPVNTQKYSQEVIEVLENLEQYNIEEIKNLIEKYPNVPTLYGYLITLYENSDNFDKAFETANELLKKFPDYLFGKIILANYYIEENQLAKVQILI